jgi:CDP-glycerol glycerophosphotransferase (TagB/SpsB family)
MKVLLYGDWPLALTYLNPVARYIQDNQPDWEVGFAGDLGMSYPVTDTTFDVVISCDELSAAPRGRLNICIFHGLASKAQAFSSLRRDAFVNTDTVFAVAGPYYQKLLLDMGVPQERVFIAGVTKFDGMQRKVLYAPTHNLQLSAIPVVRDRIYEIPNSTVHLHQWIRTGDRLHQQQFRAYYPVHEDREDVSDLIREADVIIGDFGSIIVEAIALGKQAIQVVNPQFEDWYIRVRGLTWEEMVALPEFYLPAKYGKQVYSFDELKDALGVVAHIGNASSQIVEFIKRAS